MFDFKAAAAQAVMKEVVNKIHELKPAELLKMLNEAFKAEIDGLKGDADHNGVVDLVDIESDLKVISDKSAHICAVLKAAHEAKK